MIKLDIRDTEYRKAISNLIKRVNRGDEEAENKVVDIIRNHPGYMKYFIKKFTINENRIFPRAEMESFFWIGVSKRLRKAKPDVGDPLMYICAAGYWAIRRERDNRFRRSLTTRCPECGVIKTKLSDGGPLATRWLKVRKAITLPGGIIKFEEIRVLKCNTPGCHTEVYRREEIHVATADFTSFDRPIIDPAIQEFEDEHDFYTTARMILSELKGQKRIIMEKLLDGDEVTQSQIAVELKRSKVCISHHMKRIREMFPREKILSLCSS